MTQSSDPDPYKKWRHGRPAYLLDPLTVDGPAGQVPKLLEVGAGLQDGVEGGNGEVGRLVHVETLKPHPGKTREKRIHYCLVPNLATTTFEGSTCPKCTLQVH